MSDAPTPVSSFLYVLKGLTQLSPYDLGGTDLADSYVEELVESRRDASDLLEEAAEFVASCLKEPGAYTALVRRRMIEGEDVVPLSGEAKKLEPVTACAVRLATDLDTMVAAVAALTRIPARTIRRTTLAESLLLQLREQASASEAMTKVRQEFVLTNEELLKRQRRRDLRAARGGDWEPDRASILHRTEDRAVKNVKDAIETMWRQLDPFVRFVGMLSGAIAEDAGIFCLAYRGWERLEESMLDEFAGRWDRFAREYAETDDKKKASLLRGFVTELENSESPVLAVAQDIVLDVDRFLAMSAVLTGVSRIDLVQTGMAESYLDQTIRAVGPRMTRALLDRARSVLDRGVENERQLKVQIRRRLLGDQRLGPVARAVVKCWYSGQWEALPEQWRAQYAPDQPAPPPVDVVSAEAYKRGLAWRLAGAHPQAAHQPGFGSWALPPGSGVPLAQRGSGHGD